MRYRIAHRWLERRWFAALLFTAFFCRALIPVGFMPGPGGLMLCSDYAAVPAMDGGAATTHDMSGRGMGGMSMPGMDMNSNDSRLGHGGQSLQHDSMEACPFAAAAGILAITQASAPSVMLQNVSAVITFAAENPPPHRTIVPNRLPRGPPSVA